MRNKKRDFIHECKGYGLTPFTREALNDTTCACAFQSQKHKCVT